MQARLFAMRFGIIILLGSVLPASAADVPRNDGQSWSTLHGDLTRSGFIPKFPRRPLEVVWRKELYRELTGTRSEVIVGSGLAWMGTYAGNLYAWDALTGEQRWVFQTGGPIGHSLSLDANVIYVASMDRTVYALDAQSGALRWKYRGHDGFWNSPAVWNGLVYAGDRGGMLHAIHSNTGVLAWSFQAEDRILTPTSISTDGQYAVFGSEDMHIYCCECATGTLVWKSRKLSGLSLRDHAPVIVNGLVLVGTNPVKHFHGTLDEHQNMLLKRAGLDPADRSRDPRYLGGGPAEIQREQQDVVEFLRDHPAEQTFFALRLSDGKEPWIAPILYTGGLHNPITPPCFNPDTSDVFVQLRTAYGVWDGGGEVRPYTGVGKLDLTSGRVTLIEHGHKPKEPGRAAGRKDMPWMTFNSIGDETQTLACTSDMLLSIHQGLIGSVKLSTGETHNLYGKRDTYGGYYGPGSFGWENQGGVAKAAAAGQPFGIVNEWHGPDRAMISVVGDRVYFPVGSQVICLRGKQ
jgi:hypothetical protein